MGCRRRRLDDDRHQPGRRLRPGARGPQGQRHPHADRPQGQASRACSWARPRSSASSMMLRQHGIRAEQVTVVHMAPEAQVRALETRQIDAAMVWEPWMHRMMRSANARIVETEGNLGIYTNVDCYSVRRDWLQHQPRHGAALPAGAGGRERRHQQGSQDRLSRVGPRGRAQQCVGRGDLRRRPAAPDLRMDQPALHLLTGQGRTAPISGSVSSRPT